MSDGMQPTKDETFDRLGKVVSTVIVQRRPVPTLEEVRNARLVLRRIANDQLGIEGPVPKWGQQLARALLWYTGGDETKDGEPAPVPPRKIGPDGNDIP